MPRLVGVLLVAVFLAIAALVVLGFGQEVSANDCRLGAGGRPYPVTPNSPTGIVGCEAYGEGVASTWGGPGVARNDCEYPWTDCTPIRITVLETGAWIEVRPTMYCDCYLGGPGPLGEGPRLVDIGADILASLGLPGPGLYDVRVEPAGGVVREDASSNTLLPNTAMAIDVEGEWWEWFFLGLSLAVAGGIGRALGALLYEAIKGNKRAGSR